MPQLTIPKPIADSYEKLWKIIDENPVYIPLTVVADYLEIGPESLRCALDQGRAPFGFSWKQNDRGNRAFKIPTISFYHWIMQGNGRIFVHEYTEGKN